VKLGSERLSGSQLKYILAYDSPSEVLTAEEMARRVNASVWAAYRMLSRLAKVGLVEEKAAQKVGGRGRPKKLFALTDAGVRYHKIYRRKVSLESVRLSVLPALDQILKGSTIRSIGFLERYLQDDKKSPLERALAFLLWVVSYLYPRDEESVFTPVGWKLLMDKWNLLMDDTVPASVKGRLVATILWIAMVDAIESKVMDIPDDVLMDVSITDYVVMCWDELEGYLREIEKGGQMF
jgi:DNA-binding PadR family transcriptional regulator